MPTLDNIDYILICVIVVLAICCYMCYTKPEPYAPLAYFTVAEPKYQVDSQNVMSAPIVYNSNDAGSSIHGPFHPCPPGQQCDSNMRAFGADSPVTSPTPSPTSSPTSSPTRITQECAKCNCGEYVVSPSGNRMYAMYGDISDPSNSYTDTSKCNCSEYCSGYVNPHNLTGGPVSPIGDREGFQYPLQSDIKTLVPAHLSGGFLNPLSNPQMGFLPGGIEYGVSSPAMGNLSASVSSNSSPGSLNVWSTVI